MKYLIFIVLVLTIMTVDHPQINKVRGSIVSLISDSATKAYSEGSVVDLIESNVAKSFASFKDVEEDYVKSIMTSPESIMAFYKEYCGNQKYNPNLSNYNMGTVCERIDEQMTRLDEEMIRAKR
jgi:hypothetical protein